jgi:hypothetical protein
MNRPNPFGVLAALLVVVAILASASSVAAHPFHAPSDDGPILAADLVLAVDVVLDGPQIELGANRHQGMDHSFGCLELTCHACPALLLETGGFTLAGRDVEMQVVVPAVIGAVTQPHRRPPRRRVTNLT